ncbi:MAG TPA: FAD-binding oxidoreductase [Bryobacteraceae bacterium]|nr:FAD-binding oxidoreductase [Bryobacteraceae bacterium]
MLEPQTPGELAEALGEAAGRGRTISLAGGDSKRRMAGPPPAADCAISTVRLNRVIQYEPRDLTISVEAGLPWRELARLTAANRQMAPLDPPFASNATVGGVVAANCSGPRRRLYGTARDWIIGMKFTTLEGKMVQSGGMVVKNVAGLDMAKLMIGSFGTLAAIAVVNLKLSPAPETERSFALAFGSIGEAMAARNHILAGPLQPAALELWNQAAVQTFGIPLAAAPWLLALRVGGPRAAAERHQRDLESMGECAVMEGDAHSALWSAAEDFTPRYLEPRPEGAVVRASCTLNRVDAVMASFPGPAAARAGSGVCYGYFESSQAAARWLANAAAEGWKAVLEFAPEEGKSKLDLWPAPGPDLEWMKRLKGLFDPGNLLNRGRLYGRI